MTKERIAQIEKLFESFKQGFPDPAGMQEFIGMTSRLDSGVNWTVLRDRFKRFLKLEQESARVRRWDDLYRDARGVYLEISRSMPRSEDGGIDVQ